MFMLALKLIYPRKGKNKRDKWFASYKCLMSMSVAVKMLVQQWVESQWMMMDIYWCACCMNLLQKMSIQIRIYAFLTIHHYILLLEIDEMTMMTKSCFYEWTRQAGGEWIFCAWIVWRNGEENWGNESTRKAFKTCANKRENHFLRSDR